MRAYADCDADENDDDEAIPSRALGAGCGACDDDAELRSPPLLEWFAYARAGASSCDANPSWLPSGDRRGYRATPARCYARDADAGDVATSAAA